MCKSITNLNYKKIFENNFYNYIFIDINSLTLIPYLNNNKYQSTDNINITPFIETLKLYVNYKKYFPSSKFIFVIDSGISPLITKICPEYKQHRKSPKVKSNSYIPELSKNIYDYNVGLLLKLFEIFNEIFISDINRNEADFIIGYMIKKLSINKKCLILSHDKDFLFCFNKNNNVHVIYKYINIKYKKIAYYFVDNIDCLLSIFNFQYLKNEIELLYYRALIGDVSDGIKKPFGLKNKIIINNMFKTAYIEDIQITYEYIIDYFNKKFNSNVMKRFEKDFRKNLLIMNIFNEDVLLLHDKMRLNSYIHDIEYDINNNVEINLVYELFSKYGLYFEKENIDDMIKYMKGD